MHRYDYVALQRDFIDVADIDSVQLHPSSGTYTIYLSSLQRDFIDVADIDSVQLHPSSGILSIFSTEGFHRRVDIDSVQLHPSSGILSIFLCLSVYVSFYLIQLSILSIYIYLLYMDSVQQGWGAGAGCFWLL